MGLQGVCDAVPVQRSVKSYVIDRRRVAQVEDAISSDGARLAVHAATLEWMACGAGARIVVRQPHIIEQPLSESDPPRIKRLVQRNRGNRLPCYRSHGWVLRWERQLIGESRALHQHTHQDE